MTHLDSSVKGCIAVLSQMGCIHSRFCWRLQLRLTSYVDPKGSYSTRLAWGVPPATRRCLSASMLRSKARFTARFILSSSSSWKAITMRALEWSSTSISGTGKPALRLLEKQMARSKPREKKGGGMGFFASCLFGIVVWWWCGGGGWLAMYSLI